MKKSAEENFSDEIAWGDESIEVDENEEAFPVELDDLDEA